jgi:Ca2+-binding RTX toxin-like protein
MTDFTGTSGADNLTGSKGDDLFDMSQGGNDKVSGGGGDDIFDFGASFTAKDQVNGGAGDDVLQLDGDYSAGLTFGAKSIKQIEAIVLGANFSYDLTTVNQNVAAGQLMNVDTTDLAASDRVIFDGSAETDGAFLFNVRFAKATLIGGAGDDTFHLGDRFSSGVHGAGGGGDVLTGGGGADLFVFQSLGKAGTRPHEITDLENADRIDISNIDADTHTVGDQAFVLVGAFTGHAGEALLAYDADTGKTLLQLDTNGDAKADNLIQLDADHHDFTNFVL